MKTEKPSVSYGTEGCGDGSGFDTAALVHRRPALYARGTQVGTLGRRYESLTDKLSDTHI